MVRGVSLTPASAIGINALRGAHDLQIKMKGCRPIARIVGNTQGEQPTGDMGTQGL